MLQRCCFCWRSVSRAVPVLLHIRGCAKQGSAGSRSGPAADSQHHAAPSKAAAGPASQPGSMRLAEHNQGASVPDPIHSAAATAAAVTADLQKSSTALNPADTTASSIHNYFNPALLTQVSSTFNQLTGYDGIEHIKSSVVRANRQLQECKQQLQKAKLEYDKQLSTQTQLHREVTALLQRKSSWVPTDVSRFTELYAAEHATEQAVAAAKAQYSKLSDDAERLQLQLVDLIRERYQQEQLWSDKIRRASTWWTWGLMGLHFASFIVVYTLLEPRKRAALQAAVASMLQQHQTELESKLQLLQLVPASAAAAAVSSSDSVSDKQEQQQHNAMQQAADTMQPKQQHQQPKQQQATAQQPDIQREVLQELQVVKQQLCRLQQALATTATVTTAAGVPAARPPQAVQQRHWQVPGSRWWSHQFTVVGTQAAAAWDAFKHRAADAGLLQSRYSMASQEATDNSNTSKHDTNTSSSSGSSRSGQQATLSTPGSGRATDTATNKHRQLAQTSGNKEQHQVSSTAQPAEEAANGTGQPQQVFAAADLQQSRAATEKPDQDSTATSFSNLLQQWQAGHKALEITRSQLAALAAGAGAAGAGLTVICIIVLANGRTSGSPAASAGS